MAAFAAGPAEHQDAEPEVSADAQPASPAPTASSAEAAGAAVRKRPRSRLSPTDRAEIRAATRRDTLRTSVDERESSGQSFALARRLAAPQDPQAWVELVPPGLSAAAFTARFAQFHQSAALLPLDEMGRLMYGFVSRWHGRLAKPWSPTQWWALNAEALRREAGLSARLQTCFATTYLFARGLQAQDGMAAGERVRRELVSALPPHKQVDRHEEGQLQIQRSMDFAVARLGGRDLETSSFHLRAPLLRCFIGCTSAERMARGHAGGTTQVASGASPQASAAAQALSAAGCADPK